MKKVKQLLFIFILSCFLIQSCDKDDVDEPKIPVVDPEEEPNKPTESPDKIEIISGNNQLGYKGYVLPNAIYIEIIPKNIKDLEYYDYRFDFWSTRLAGVEKKEDRVILEIEWQMIGEDVNQKTILSIYSILNMKEDGTNKPIATIEINASIKKTWELVFTDTGNTFGPGDFLDIHFSDDQNGIVIGDYFNGNAKTTDGGNSWKFVDKFRSDMFSITFYDNLNGFVEVTNSWAYFTNDGGNTFFEKDWTPPSVGHRATNDFLMIDANTIFSVGENGSILKTINSGNTWLKYAGFNFNNSLNSITAINKNILFACGQIGKIVKTINGGESWTQLDLLLNNDLNKIYFIDELVGFAGGTYGILVRTSDSGTTWNIVETMVNSPIIDIYFFNKNLGYIVTTTGEISKTTDGGKTWYLVNIGNYGINGYYGLTKVYFKDSKTLLGINGNSIFKYELDNN